MLETHEKFRMIDKNGKNHFFAEVNWNLKDEATNKCQVIKFTLPDGSETFIDPKHLLELLFAIGREEDQVKMIPQKEERVHWHETVLSVKALKDIRKGESLTFPIKVSMPCPYATREFIGKIKRPGAVILPRK